uniref:Ig-like domain-containing protein n=1 Tax=Balaenoptera musculus TaxID=9771 RepID=A0A8C0DQS4_BALMU
MGLGSRLLIEPHLYCVSASSTGPVDAAVTQKPRYHIIRAGNKMVLECSQHMNHLGMFWYRQDPGQGPRLIHYSNGVGSTGEGDITEGYSVSRNKTEHFPLTLESASTNETSLYLCASSESTAWHGHRSPHKNLSRRREADTSS